MDELELQTLLAEHGRAERSMLAAERARILERLDRVDSNPADQTDAEGAVDITPWRDAPGDNRQMPLAIAAAVLAVLAIGSLIAFVGSNEEPSIAVVAEPENAEPTRAPVPSPTATPVPAPVCPTAVLEFMAAVDAWDGIDQWAALVDDRRPDPDLPLLAAAALADWQHLDPDDPLHEGLEVPVEEPVIGPQETITEFSARRAEPLNLAFVRLRTAASAAGTVLAPCAGDIEAVAAELGLSAEEPPG